MAAAAAAAAAAADKVVFYDIANKHGRYWAPNPWVSRMCVVHKGLAIESRNVPLDELRAHGPGTFRERLQHALGPEDRPLVPMIDVPLGGGKEGTTLVGDTITIAEFLDAHFPNAPSLFLPARPVTGTSPDPNDPEFVQAHAMARLMKEGIGNSDSQWSLHFELCAAEVADSYESPHREYMMSDAKLGLQNGWDLFESMDRAEMLAHTRRSLLPFCAILNPPKRTPRIAGPSSSSSSSSSSPPKLVRPEDADGSLLPQRFLASRDHPGFLDYVLFGRFAMTRGCAPELNRAIWSSGSGPARAWLGSYRGGTWALQGSAAQAGMWLGDVELPGIEGWVERMLDAFGGYARALLDGQQQAL